MKDLLDILATGFLFLTIGGALYALAMLIFNGFLSALKFRIKLPVQKRFVGKMTPIYRLTNWDDYEKNKSILFKNGCWNTLILKWVLGKQFGYHFHLCSKDYNMLNKNILT